MESPELRANHQQHSFAGCQASAIADRLSEHRVECPAGGGQRSCDISAIRNQAAYLRRSVEAANGALRIALEQYEQGATSFTTVLTAEQNLFQAQNSLAGASANVPLGLTAVFRALGGGWQIREGGNFVSPATVDQMRARTDWGNLLRPRTSRNRRLRACRVLRISDRRSGLRSGDCRGSRTYPSSSTKRGLCHEMCQAVVCRHLHTISSASVLEFWKTSTHAMPISTSVLWHALRPPNSNA